MLKDRNVGCVQRQARSGTLSGCQGFPAMRSTLPRNADFLIQRAKDPITGFKDAIDAPWKPVCQVCAEVKRSEWRRQRSKFWEKTRRLAGTQRSRFVSLSFLECTIHLSMIIIRDCSDALLYP